MATQAELAAQIDALTIQLFKVQAEVIALKTENTELKTTRINFDVVIPIAFAGGQR